MLKPLAFIPDESVNFQLEKKDKCSCGWLEGTGVGDCLCGWSDGGGFPPDIHPITL